MPRTAIKTSRSSLFDVAQMTFGDSYPEDSSQSITAYFEMRKIGRLELERTSETGLTGEITSIHVDEDYRRMGVATALWNEALRRHDDNRNFLKPRHSAYRTDDGEAWARSFGTRLPKWEREDWSS